MTDHKGSFPLRLSVPQVKWEGGGQNGPAVATTSLQSPGHWELHSCGNSPLPQEEETGTSETLFGKSERLAETCPPLLLAQLPLGASHPGPFSRISSVCR